MALMACSHLKFSPWPVHHLLEMKQSIIEFWHREQPDSNSKKGPKLLLVERGLQRVIQQPMSS